MLNILNTVKVYVIMDYFVTDICENNRLYDDKTSSASNSRFALLGPTKDEPSG